MCSYVFRSVARNGRRSVSPGVLLGVAVILMLLSAGCATVGRDFPAERVSEIQIGKTTQNEIRAMFGSPWRVGIEDGQRTWTYGKYRYKAFSQTSTQDLVVRFDERNVVSSYTFNTTDHPE